MSHDLRASIDIGSNSILLLVVDASDDFRVLANESNVTGLGRDLDKNKKFLEIAMKESYEVLRSYVKQCRDLGLAPQSIIATATEASRVSQNAGEFFEKVKNELHLNIVTITGEGEAYYSASGVLYDQNIKDDTITIMDIGGASTELIKVNKSSEKILTSFSMPVGVVRINNWRQEGSFQERMDQILKDYSEHLSLVESSKLYCVAGTMTSVGSMNLGLKSFEEEKINGLELKSSDVTSMLKNYQGLTPSDLLEKFPFLGKRSKTIYSGLILADQVLERLKVEDIYISTFGLRYGTILFNGIKEQYVWKRKCI